MRNNRPIKSIQDIRAALIGIILISMFFFMRMSYIRYEEGMFHSEGQSLFYGFFLIGIPILSRIVFFKWIRKLAYRADKSVKFWSVFSIINPNICLIILGLSEQIKN
ncbi:hypothetical protein [Tenacibaculum sp. 190524A02b]|uniref:Uncharacterized protein n=1 Tax=Tenacibaculum vairaonense TaxID=3137860 RepID=A0ABM9PII2_9FLAO